MRSKIVNKNCFLFMMTDGRVENIQILFSDKAEGIDYIRKIEK